MKILSWVHKKFHNNVLKEGPNYEHAKKEGLSMKCSETKALLKQIALVDMHGWEDGFLSIGTFGFEDPFEPFNQECYNFTLTNEEQENDDQEEQYVNNGYDLSDDIDSVNQEHELDQLVIHSSEYVQKGNMQGVKLDEIKDFDTAAYENASSIEGDAKKTGERVTLADLFMADSEVKKNIDCNKLIKQDVGKKASITRKDSKSSFAKKLIFGGKQDSIKKIPKLVKRMLKKKIHPEIGGKGEKKNVHFKPCVHQQLLNEDEIAVGESISLLLT